MYIDRQSELNAFVQRAHDYPLLAIDTEFLRERTYYPRLCLIQLATSESEATIVDPLAVEDLTPLAELLTDESITKIFHAAGQDLEIRSSTPRSLRRFSAIPNRSAMAR